MSITVWHAHGHAHLFSTPHRLRIVGTPCVYACGKRKKVSQTTSATFLLCMHDWLWLSFATYSESTTSRLLILCVCAWICISFTKHVVVELPR